MPTGVDQTEMLQAAIDAAPSGAKICLAPGVFSISRPLRIRRPVQVVSEGGATIRSHDRIAVEIHSSGCRVNGISFALNDA